MDPKHKRAYSNDYLGWWGYCLSYKLANMVPLSWAYFCAHRIGDLLFLFSRRNKKTITKNLSDGPNLSGDELTRAVRSVFRNFCSNVVDFLCFEKFDEEWFKKYGDMLGVDELEDAYKKGKGVILLSAHLGNVEMGALMLHMFGFTTNGIYLAHKNVKVDKFYLNQRIKKGLKVIHSGGAFLKACDALKSGELVAFVADHSYGKRGVEVEFFGKKADIPNGAVLAAIKTGAKIVPAVCVRLGGCRYKVVCGHEVKTAGLIDQPGGQARIIQNCINEIEKLIRQYPDQWVLSRYFSKEYFGKSAMAAEGSHPI